MQWLLTLAGFLPFLSVSCEDIRHGQNGGVASAFDQQYNTLGSSEVVISCLVSQATSAVEWRVNDSPVADGMGSRRGGLLLLQNVSLAHEREYICHDTATGQILRRVLLKLGYPPEQPVIRCGSVSYVAVNCTWHLETETHLPTSFISMYRHGLEGEVYECAQAAPTANSCSITNVQLFSTDPYVLNVTAVNPLGTATSLSFIFLDQILKPDPPEAVKVSPIKGERKKLLLTWKPPSSWLFAEYFPLKYLIRYSVVGSGSSTKIMSKTTEQTSFTLTGIRPGVIYHVQVAAKDALDNGEYSNWSLAASGTAWSPER